MDAIKKYEQQLKRAIESSDFDSYEANYEENFLKTAGGLGLPMIKRATARPTGIAGNPSPKSYVAQIDLRISYLQQTEGRLNAKLDVPLFAPELAFAQYPRLETYNSGISLNMGNVFNTGGVMEYMYYNSSEYIKIKVEGVNFYYTPFLMSLMTSEVRLSKIRFKAPHEDAAAYFFNTRLKTYGISNTGKVFDDDSLPFLSQSSPLQYDKRILDVDVNVILQKDRGLIYQMPEYNAISTNPLTLSLFIEAIAR